jgi:molybdopterin converting factor small subunit
MATVVIPSLMRDLTAGRERVGVPGKTVREVIEALDATYPGFKSRLCSGDEIGPGISVWVDGRLSPLGMMQALGEHSEIQFLQAMGGG